MRAYLPGAPEGVGLSEDESVLKFGCGDCELIPNLAQCAVRARFLGAIGELDLWPDRPLVVSAKELARISSDVDICPGACVEHGKDGVVTVLRNRVSRDSSAAVGPAGNDRPDGSDLEARYDAHWRKDEWCKLRQMRQSACGMCRLLNSPKNGTTRRWRIILDGVYFKYRGQKKFWLNEESEVLALSDIKQWMGEVNRSIPRTNRSTSYNRKNN